MIEAGRQQQVNIMDMEGVYYFIKRHGKYCQAYVV